MHIKLFVFFILTYSVSAAQSSLKGVVLSSYEKEPLPFMDILVMSTTQSLDTKTDWEGQFTAKPLLKAGKYRLISKYPGFKVIDTTIFIPADTIIFVTLFTEKVIIDRNALGINAISAKDGIKNGNLSIYLMDSMNSNLSNEDLRFEFLYHIKYINVWKAPIVGVDRGLVSLCGTGKYDMKYSEYNKIVFNHFDKKYKRGWRHQVNRYAIGL